MGSQFVSAIPITSIFSDYSQNPKNLNTESISIDELISAAKQMIEYLQENEDLSRNQAINITQSSDPFKSYWSEIKEEI